MMENYPSVESHKHDPYITKEDIKDLEFQRELFADPVRRLSIIKHNLLEAGDEEQKIEYGLLESLEIIIECLKNNVYGFENNIPNQILPLLLDDAEEDHQEDAYIFLAQKIRISKAVLRAWVIESFHEFEVDEIDSSQDALTERSRLQRMLIKIEKKYEEN